MKRWSVAATAGSLALLVSLYLPWEEVSTPSTLTRFSGGAGTIAGLQNLFSGTANLNVDGWSTGAGGPAALSALLLVACLARSARLNSSPVGRCGLLLGYFAVAVAADARSNARYREAAYRQTGGLHFHYAYGAYIGVAGGAIALLAAGALRRNALLRRRSALQVAEIVLAAGLLASFLLPWERFASIQRTVSLGIESPAAVLAAAVVCASFGWAAGSSAGRLGLSATALLLVGAAFSSVAFGAVHLYGAWIALGFGVAVVAIAIADRATVQARSGWPAKAVAAAAALFLASLFLPWQKVCYPTGSSLGPYAGRCLTTNGWTAISGSTAGVLSLLLTLVVLLSRRLAVSAAELVIAISLLVATLGFELIPSGNAGLHVGYGAIVGFSAVALLVVVVATRFRPPAPEWRRRPVCLLPIGACLGYLAVLVVPWWDVLPRRAESLVRLAPVSWLTVASALLGIHLLFRWLRSTVAADASRSWLVLTPLALLGLAALDLIRLRDEEITWGGGVVVGLCILLAVLGRVETQSGLENMRVPEILRVDRL